MLINFDNQGSPFIDADGLRLLPDINALMSRYKKNGKAILLYIACMVDYQSPFLIRFPKWAERHEAVLKAYGVRPIAGGGQMLREDVENNELVEKAISQYLSHQKDAQWDFYHVLAKKIAEADEVLDTQGISLANVDEQKKMIALRKDSQVTFEDVRKTIFTKVSKATASGKAKAYQLKDLEFKR